MRRHISEKVLLLQNAAFSSQKRCITIYGTTSLTLIAAPCVRFHALCVGVFDGAFVVRCTDRMRGYVPAYNVT